MPVASDTRAPWLDWEEPRGSSARCIRWIETFVVAVRGATAGKPIVLLDFQKEWLRRVLDDVDEDGEPLGVPCSIAVLSVARGNGKSTFMAAFALWALFDPATDATPQIPIVATTVKQAMRAVWDQMVLMVRRQPVLMERAKIFTSITNPRLQCVDNWGEAFPIADDPDGLQGLDPTIGIMDEIGHHTVSSWDALLLASGKNPTSVIVGCGTVGPKKVIRGEANALFALDQANRRSQLDRGVVFQKFSAPEGCAVDDMEAWRAANPALGSGMMDLDRLITAAATTPAHHLRMFRLNQWVSAVGSWLGDGANQIVEPLYDDGYLLVPGEPTWVGVDIGTTVDSTGVVAMQRRTDDPTRWHALGRIWMPAEGRKVDIDDVGQWLVELAAMYDVQTVAYDPKSFRDAAIKLEEEHGLTMQEFPQGTARMAPATMTAFELWTTGGLSWSTHDLAQRDLFVWQITNAEARYLDEGGMRLSKSKSEEKIDAAIAFAMCADVAVTVKKRKKRSYYGGVVR